MKLNHNLLTLLTLALFTLASCSQARYGHLTRKVKMDKNHMPESVVKDKSDKPVKSQDNLDQITEEVVNYVETDIQSEAVVAMNPSENSSNHSEVMQLKEKTLTVANNFGSPVTQFIAQKTIDKFEQRLAPQQSADDDLMGLLKIILIILLILIIVDLIASFLPIWFRGVLGAIIAILIILWILQYLS